MICIFNFFIFNANSSLLSNLFANNATSVSLTISSLSPCIIKPETGQGAKKLKSYLSAGGDKAIKACISGFS